MESNKPLSVHMTHNEYEQYKKYLSLVKSKGKQIFYGSREEEHYGQKARVEYTIYSREEVKYIVDSFLKDHIARLEEEKQYLRSKLESHHNLCATILDENAELKQKFKSSGTDKIRKGWFPWN